MLHSTRPAAAGRSETSSSRVIFFSEDRWTFYEEVAAESLGGLPRGVKGGGEEDKEGEKKEWEGDVGRVQATAVMWMKNPKNSPLWMNSRQMLL